MTLETILKTILHVVAWSALVAFCGVVAGVGVRWILCKLGDALSETMHRHGKWAAMMLTSLALVCAVVAQKANTNAPLDGVSAPMMQRAGVAATPSSSQGGGCDGEGATATSGCDGEGAAATPANMQRPANAQDVEEWDLRGAYDDAIRIPVVGWDFRTPEASSRA